jgi:F-type H+-transporting ATPase subunit b
MSVEDEPNDSDALTMIRSKSVIPGVVVLSWALGPRVAWAAEGPEHTPSLFSGDYGNIIWTLIIFGVVLVVLGKYVWPPILRALQRREAFIHDSLQQARQDREEAELRLKQYTEQLAKAREEASAIVDEGRRDAEVVKRKIESAARREGDAMIERARREITTARDTAVKDLYQLTARLSTEVAARIIRQELDAKSHERLIEESIEELAKLRDGSGHGTA